MGNKGSTSSSISSLDLTQVNKSVTEVLMRNATTTSNSVLLGQSISFYTEQGAILNCGGNLNMSQQITSNTKFVTAATSAMSSDIAATLNAAVEATAKANAAAMSSLGAPATDSKGASTIKQVISNIIQNQTTIENLNTTINSFNPTQTLSFKISAGSQVIVKGDCNFTQNIVVELLASNIVENVAKAIDSAGIIAKTVVATKNDATATGKGAAEVVDSVGNGISGIIGATGKAINEAIGVSGMVMYIVIAIIAVAIIGLVGKLAMGGSKAAPPQQFSLSRGLPPQPQYGLPPQPQYGLPPQPQYGLPPQPQYGLPQYPPQYQPPQYASPYSQMPQYR